MSEGFFHQRALETSTMGLKKNRIKVVDLIPKGREFSYLVVSEEIVFRKESDFDIPGIERNFGG